MFPVLLDHLHVGRVGPGRPRTRPDRLRADKAHSSRGNRALLRARGIGAVIPEPSDQIRNRQRRGRRAPTSVRPARLPGPQRHRTLLLPPQAVARALATRCDKLAVVYRGAAVLRAIVRWLKTLGATR
jgi:hypothetical protein